VFSVLFYDVYYKIPSEHVYVAHRSIVQHDVIHVNCSSEATIKNYRIFKEGMEFVPEVAVRIWRV